MKSISCFASLGHQKGVRIFCGLMRAGDLVKATTVDRYDSTLSPTDPKQGYQRPPERSRITRIGSFLIGSILKEEEGDGLFPSAVTLAARTPLQYDPESKQLTLRVDQPLQVVDGQHRLAGLRYAIEEKEQEELADYPIPFVIFEPHDRFAEMNQFRIINSTAKSVRTDLVNSILTNQAAKLGDDSIAAKDRWKVAVTKVIDRLDKDPLSPWQGLILMPDEAGSPKGINQKKIVRATSFMTSLKPVYDWLSEFKFFAQCNSLDEEAEILFKIISEYWKALNQVVPKAFQSPEEYVIQKTPGLFSLHKLLSSLLNVMFTGRREWTSENFQLFLEESPEIRDEGFWHKNENRASAYGSMKGFDELFKELQESIQPKPMKS